MVGNPQAIPEFWRAFQDHEAELAAASSANDPVYDLLLDRLQQINPGLFFEFSSEPGSSEIIITAEGDSSLFPLVESVVASAPAIAGWSVISLKPKLGFPVTATWEGFTVTIADVVFEPLGEGTDDLGLRMFIRGLALESTEDAHNALLRAIDHALGERQFAESVHYTEVHPLPSDAALKDYPPLTQLEDYIRRRKKKREDQNGQQIASRNGRPAKMLTWATARKEYEGFPLMLRRPTNLDVDSLRPSHPTLAVVTHEFSKRKPNGLPEPDYNESLFEMDIALVEVFDVDQMGVPALVETFGGKRHYYFYVASDTDVPAIISAFARRYPSERLSWTVRPDPEWGFLERYAKEYF